MIAAILSTIIAAILVLMLTTDVHTSVGIGVQPVKAEIITYQPLWCANGYGTC